MALPKITINKQTGNLFRTSTNLDALTAIVFDSVSPVDFPDAQEFFSIRQAETAGITEDDYAVEHYQLTEIFRINPNARVTVAFGDITSASTFNALRAKQPRQVGYFTSETLTTAMVAQAKSRANELEAAEAPASIVIGANLAGTSTASLPDLTTLAAGKVSVVIGQGAGTSKAAALAESTGKSVPALGTTLGRLSLCNVAESIGFVQLGDVAGAELQEVALANGVPFSALSKAEADAIDDKGYIILMKYANLAGTYFNGAATATDDDLNTIELNRVLDKAIRATRRALTPKLNSSLRLTDAGLIEQIYVTQFEKLVNKELEAMSANNEISKYRCTINPLQNILEDKTLEVNIAIVPFGTAKFITVNIGFQASL